MFLCVCVFVCVMQSIAHRRVCCWVNWGNLGFFTQRSNGGQDTNSFDSEFVAAESDFPPKTSLFLQ